MVIFLRQSLAVLLHRNPVSVKVNVLYLDTDGRRASIRRCFKFLPWPTMPPTSFRPHQWRSITKTPPDGRTLYGSRGVRRIFQPASLGTAPCIRRKVPTTNDIRVVTEHSIMFFVFCVPHSEHVGIPGAIRDPYVALAVSCVRV